MNSEAGANEDTRKKIITIPNLMSCFRLCLIPVIVWLYCVEEKDMAAGLVLVLSGATDMADGFIARRFHMISDLGKVLDPIADKLTQASMLFCLCTRFPLMLLPLAFLALKECYMGISGFLLLRKTGQVFGAYWHGKAATVLLYAVMILHVFWKNIPEPLSDLLIGASTGMVLISLLFYGKRNLRILRTGKTE